MRHLDALTDVFRQVFPDEDDLALGPNTTADNVEGWDSMSHVTLVLAIETRFGLKFTQKELMSFRNVGDMLRVLEARVA
jgi:acyl carrier protein